MKITVLGAVLIAVTIVSAVRIIRHLNDKKDGEPHKSTN